MTLTYWSGFTGIELAGMAAIAGIIIGSLLTGLIHWWKGGGRDLDRTRRLAALDQAARTPVTINVQRCHRCRTGHGAWPCTCDTLCPAPGCAGWMDDAHRAIRGTCTTCNGHGCPDCLGKHGSDWGVL